ncbi:MAG: hypothetical protein FJY10_04415 [Bacteroidetes bacterium]|nr:hypothetical protein [Bacteroidota bacterium]
MHLIADSGSTKTDWVVLESDKDHVRIKTAGINPYYQSTGDIMEIIGNELAPDCKGLPIQYISFYGAGCSTPAKHEIIKTALAAYFPNAQTEVFHDILGAARALFGENPGIACILGTGSNSCLYDGKDIIENIRSLGFILGDEGGGSNIGKVFITHYLRHLLPQDIEQAFKKQFNLTLENILDGIYNQPKPGRFLASFSGFIHEHRTDPSIHAIVYDSFSRFLENYVMKYSNYRDFPVSFTGSIAYHFQDILQEALHHHGLKPGTMMQSPIDGLISYYMQVE